ncbi:MAG: hypothetical protein E7299_10890 [Lachnospiraceae bacterium]|nr:hypothetical protein [Lachnospiraceae bacterium]
MPEIVLLVLKIIGMILLAIVAIVLLLAVALLFLPVRYNVKAEADSEKKDENEKFYFDLKLKATWLLLFAAYVEYQKKQRIRFKILGITVYDSAKHVSTEKKQKKETDKIAKEEKKEKEENTASDNDVKEKDTKESEKKEKEEQTKNPFRKLRYAIERFCDTLRNIKEKKDAVINLWNDAQTVKCRNLIVQELLYLLKHLKPGKIQGFLHFGFDDPAMTGYGMAAYGMMIPVWGDFLTVEPEFEDTILQTSLIVKGKMKGFTFLKVFLRLCFSSDFRSVIKKVKALK